jgi:hypothetical protein
MAVFSGKFRHRFDLMSPVLGSDGYPARNDFGEETGELKILQRPIVKVTQLPLTDKNNLNLLSGTQRCMKMQLTT